MIAELLFILWIAIGITICIYREYVEHELLSIIKNKKVERLYFRRLDSTPEELMHFDHLYDIIDLALIIFWPINAILALLVFFRKNL